MKILQLTLTDGRKIYVNFNLVTDFITDFYNGKEHTMLCFGTEHHHFKVEESAEYIYDVLSKLPY